MESPYYGNNEKTKTQHLPRIPTAYTSVTKQKPADLEADLERLDMHTVDKEEEVNRVVLDRSIDTVLTTNTTSISDFLNLPNSTQIQIIVRVLKSIPNPNLKNQQNANQIQMKSK